MQGVDRTSVLHPPVYCGIGTGQHMYLNAEEGTDLCATMDILLGAGSTAGRTWNIRVTQIPCGVNYAPPSTDCLQYHTGELTHQKRENPSTGNFHNEPFQ